MRISPQGHHDRPDNMFCAYCLVHYVFHRDNLEEPQQPMLFSVCVWIELSHENVQFYHNVTR